MCRGCRKVVKSGWYVVRPWMGSFHTSDLPVKIFQIKFCERAVEKFHLACQHMCISVSEYCELSLEECTKILTLFCPIDSSHDSIVSLIVLESQAHPFFSLTVAIQYARWSGAAQSRSPKIKKKKILAIQHDCNLYRPHTYCFGTRLT